MHIFQELFHSYRYSVKSLNYPHTDNISFLTHFKRAKYCREQWTLLTEKLSSLIVTLLIKSLNLLIVNALIL